MDKKQKVINLLKLKEAKEKGEAEYVLHQRMEELRDVIDEIKEKSDEDIIVDLQIE